MQKFVTSVSADFGEPIVTSTGAADAGKIVALDENGRIDQSVLPIQVLVPPGGVQYFAMPTAPTGWLAADGSIVSRISYADLFAVIGTTFGAGDDTTTFNLPDLRAEFVRGYDNGRGVDSERLFGSFQTDVFKSHNHRIIDTRIAGVGFKEGAMQLPYEYADNTSRYTDNFGGSETRPRNVALLACIKY